MAILKIARMGHPVLRQRALPVPDPGAADVEKLVADMFETMEDAGGVGLAAPQVHVPLRLFVWAIPPMRLAADAGSGPAPDPASGPALDEAAAAPLRGVLINPVLTPLDDAVETRLEGCLSIPGLRGEVERHARIAYEGLDLAGGRVAGEASGLLAVVMQHETDHLDGILYTMRMKDIGRLGFSEELARFPRAAPPHEAEERT